MNRILTFISEPILNKMVDSPVIFKSSNVLGVKRLENATSFSELEDQETRSSKRTGMTFIQPNFFVNITGIFETRVISKLLENIFFS